MSKNIKKAVVILLDLRSKYNVGSIFRTADCAGIEKIYCVGTTPIPIDRFGRPVKEIVKTALGGEMTVSWEYVKNPKSILNKLKKEKFYLIAIEQDKKSIDYKKVKPKYPAAFILGNEVSGIDKNILKICDVVSEIKMNGEKESLNVSVAFGIAVFRMLGL